MLKTLIEYLAWRFHRFQDIEFDRRYQVDTAPEVSSSLDDIESINKDFAVPYEPVQVFMFKRMMRDADIDPTGFTFLDLGSGKGRAVLLACLAGFREVVGVEFDPSLHRVAQENAKHLEKTANGNFNVTLVCEDASEFILPDSDLVVFLYNPFFGPVMDVVVGNIAQFIDERSHDIVILYRNPECSPLFDALKGLRLINDAGSYRIYRKRLMRT